MKDPTKIRTPIPFLLDFARYATTREIEPAHPGAPDLEFTLDYALLAADLDACKWPDELVETVAGLVPENDKEEDAEIRAIVNVRAGDYVATRSPFNGGATVTTNLCPASSIPVMSDILAERQRQVEKGYDAGHDDQFPTDTLSDAAMMIIAADSSLSFGANAHAEAIADHVLDRHGKDPRRCYTIAAALLVAEIERLDRLKPS